MKINGGVRFCEQGMKASIRAMHLQTEIIGLIGDNINGFDKVGFQRRDPVVSSFSEYIGIHGLSKAVDETVGRIAVSENPLDVAICTQGYFQIDSPEGVRLTRDGRFKYDKEGNLLTVDDAKVLSASGTPIKLHVVPEKEQDVIINSKGQISVYNKETKQVEYVDTLAVVNSEGYAVVRPELKQGYNEYSNVSMYHEFMSMLSPLRAFDANRQIFIMENTNLQKAISQLGSAS